jgi:hypothetical protein
MYEVERDICITPKGICPLHVIPSLLELSHTIYEGLIVSRLQKIHICKMISKAEARTWSPWTSVNAPLLKLTFMLAVTMMVVVQDQDALMDGLLLLVTFSTIRYLPNDIHGALPKPRNLHSNTQDMTSEHRCHTGCLAYTSISSM